MQDNIVNISIQEYLEAIGIKTRREGGRWFASSPFSRDSNWSFCIYPTNTYFDFSTGHGGNIINLVAKLDNISLKEAADRLRAGIKYELYKPNYAKAKEQLFKSEDFDVEKFINKDEKEIKAITAYAKSRGITDGYICGVFFTRSDRDLKKWTRVPALGFIHVTKDLRPCGIKFRKITQGTPKDQSARFSARGSLGFYILNMVEFPPEHTVLYVVESESSANSLHSYLKSINKNSIVLSRGGVSSAPKLEDLPIQLQGLKKKLIIDYDGNEELYQQRLKLYNDLGAEPIKLILEKGEDLNSLYCKGEIWKVEQMLL